MSEKPSLEFQDYFILRQMTTVPRGQYTIVLLGSSLFRRFKYYSSQGVHFKDNPQILNLGYSLGGYRIRNVQKHIDKGLLCALKTRQPNVKLIYIQMGDMDLTATGLQESDAQAYAKVIKSIRDELPNVEIVITAFFVQRRLSEAVIGEANQKLQAIANENGEAVSFLPFGEDQAGIMSDDLIHPNNAGYEKWYDILRSDMNSRYAWGERKHSWSEKKSAWSERKSA